jgi:hypothetical protein
VLARDRQQPQVRVLLSIFSRYGHVTWVRCRQFAVWMCRFVIVSGTPCFDCVTLTGNDTVALRCRTRLCIFPSREGAVDSHTHV